MAETITIVAPAKVNLYLGIHEGRDERGYHRADSVMIALALHDEVTVASAPSLEVEVTPPLDVPGEKTVVARAARALAKACDVEPQAHIHVVRTIPDKSGMGSASTDTAAALLGLCQLWGIAEDDPRVLEVARAAGADVAFFLNPVPSLLVGVGDVLKEAFPPLSGVPVVLARPEGGVSTVEAYAEFDRLPTPPADYEPLCAALRASDVAGVTSTLSNNLAPAACRLEPQEQEVLDVLLACPGVNAAQVTGSGSCVFGLCENAEAAEAAARAAAAHGWWSCATQTA